MRPVDFTQNLAGQSSKLSMDTHAVFGSGCYDLMKSLKIRQCDINLKTFIVLRLTHQVQTRRTIIKEYMMLTRNFIAATLLGLSSMPAAATTIYELNAFSRGCYDGDVEVCSGSGTPDGIFYTGEGSSVFEGDIRRSFFAFDLSGLGGNVISGEIYIEIDQDAGYRGDDPSEGIAFYPISDDSLDQLVNGSFLPGSGFYSDLGTGINLGGTTVTPADALNGFVTYDMGAQWISALNAGLGGNFGFGGRLFTTTVNGNREGLFGNNGTDPTAFTLTITTDEVPPVPLPAAAPLLLGALSGLCFLRRRQRSKCGAAKL
jgi:hypothetical protein